MALGAKMKLSKDELRNLANDPAHAGTLSGLRAILLDGWDPQVVDQKIRTSQAERLFLKATPGTPVFERPTRSAARAPNMYGSNSSGMENAWGRGNKICRTGLYPVQTSYKPVLQTSRWTISN